MAKEKRKIIFRRIRGRIVPIRVKSEDLQGLSKFAGAGAVTLGSAFFAARSLKESNKLFNKSALIRGARRLGTPGSKTSIQLAKKASSAARLAAKRLAKSRFSIFGGALAASILASSAVGDILAPRVSEETKEVAQTIASIGSALTVAAVFGKVSKLRGFSSSLKASAVSGSPDEQLGILFGKFSREGREKTRRLIEKIGKTKDVFKKKFQLKLTF